MTSGTAHRYACHGIVLESNVALVGPAASQEAHTDLVADLRMEKVTPASDLIPLWMDSEGESLLGCRRGDAATLVFPDVAQFAVDLGPGAIQAHPLREDVTLDRVQHLLLNHVLPLVLAMGGACILHGAAVGRDDESLAILGPSGRGKSTIALALARRGAPLLGDDAVQVTRDGAQLQVMPSYPAIRLWDEDAQANEVPIDAPSDAKRCLPAAMLGLPHASRPHRLRAIYVLVEGTSSAWRSTRLRGTACFDAIVRNAFLAEGLPGASVADHMERLGDIAAEIPMYALERGGRDAASLDALAAELWKDDSDA